MNYLAIVGLFVAFAAGFAHYEIPKFTRGAGHRALAAGNTGSVVVIHGSS
jgi:hypothetical protein